MRHQVSEKIGPWVNEAIDICTGGGEPILWEPQLMADPSHRLSGVVVVCVFWITGVGGPGSMQGSFTIADPVLVTKQEVYDLVDRFLTQMFEAREKAFAALHEKKAAEDLVVTPTPPQRGQTASGLFIATR